MCSPRHQHILATPWPEMPSMAIAGRPDPYGLDGPAREWCRCIARAVTRWQWPFSVRPATAACVLECPGGV